MSRRTILWKKRIKQLNQITVGPSKTSFSHERKIQELPANVEYLIRRLDPSMKEEKINRLTKKLNPK